MDNGERKISKVRTRRPFERVSMAGVIVRACVRGGTLLRANGKFQGRVFNAVSSETTLSSESS